jgi:hypothetical protein
MLPTVKPLAVIIAAAALLAQQPVVRQAGNQITGQIGLTSTPPAPVSLDCAAEGSVVNSITREPIVRAHVSFNGGGTSFVATTDSGGRWVLTNVACAPGQLTASRPGFLPNNGLRRGGNGVMRGLTLVSGSPAHDLTIELIPQAVAFGKVQDSEGDPVPNVQVMLLVLHVVDGKPRFSQSVQVQTNDLGEYRIANVSPGKYVVCAHQNQPGNIVPSSTQTISVESCYPGPLENGAASAMQFPAGRENKVDFTIGQVLPIHVRGTISGLREGRGVGINLVRRNINSDYASNLPGAVRGDTFDFRVPPGSYMLTADYFEAGKRLTARVPVDAGTADIDNVEVHLDAGFTVSGAVHAVSQAGKAAQFPQFGITLRPAEPVNGTSQLKWDADHTTFAFQEMVAGSYRLEVFPPSPYYVQSATLGGQDMLGSALSISSGAGPIVITLSDDGASVEGDVVDSSGQPCVAGVMLIRGSRATNVSVPPSGHFKVSNVAPGDYMIYAWDDAAQVQYAVPEWMRRYAGGGLPVSVSAGQNSQVKLTRQQVPE